MLWAEASWESILGWDSRVLKSVGGEDMGGNGPMERGRGGRSPGMDMRPVPRKTSLCWDLRPWALVKAFFPPVLQLLLDLSSELWKPMASLTWFCQRILSWRSAS